MRIINEPDHIIDRIAEETGHDPDFVRSVVSDLRHVIDREVSNDTTVVVAPLVFARKGDPVFKAVVERFTPADWQEPYGLKSLGPRELAKEIGVDTDLVEKYPIFFAVHVLALLFDHRGLDWEDRAGDPIADIFDAWRSTFDATDETPGRSYQVSHVGRESDFEQWLAANMHVLAEAGYPVELVKRQYRLSTGGIADMVCRVTRDEGVMRAGDYLIIGGTRRPRSTYPRSNNSLVMSRLSRVSSRTGRASLAS